MAVWVASEEVSGNLCLADCGHEMVVDPEEFEVRSGKTPKYSEDNLGRLLVPTEFCTLCWDVELDCSTEKAEQTRKGWGQSADNRAWLDDMVHLHELFAQMQLPVKRLNLSYADIRWLARNLSIQNGDHASYQEAIDLIEKFLREIES